MGRLHSHVDGKLLGGAAGVLLEAAIDMGTRAMEHLTQIIHIQMHGRVVQNLFAHRFDILIVVRLRVVVG